MEMASMNWRKTFEPGATVGDVFFGMDRDGLVRTPLKDNVGGLTVGEKGPR
jgi:hypothetical protein